MAVPSSSALKEPRAASDSGSDSEDDDFVPEGEPSHAVTKPSKAAAVDNNADQDSDDDDDSDTETAARREAAAAAEEIDADELEALKRERAELVAAAGGEDRLGKRRRLAQTSATESTESIAASDEAEAAKAKALAEWEAIKGSGPPPTATEAATSSSTNGDAAAITADSQSGSASTSLAQQDEMISIPTTYKFAGEVHTSTRLLPRSHPEAIKYLVSQTAATTSTTSTTPAATTSSIPDASTSTAGTARPSRPPPPGPRRKKTSSLASLSAAVTAKPTKLNTLEKSKLDWDSFKGDTAKLSRQELDELENQTKGGGKGLGDMKGYLERRDFLDRVKDRTGQP